MVGENHNTLLKEQIAYYRARAKEYDEWFFRKGRYDHGEKLNRHWFNEVEQVRQSLDRFKPAGRVLELACGTGLWTGQLLRHASQVTAVDAVPEVLVINQNRVGSKQVQYIQADIYEWSPPGQYDVVFFGFWLSHVPPERFEEFWELVNSALEQEGRVFFVDSRYDPTSTAKDHRLEGDRATTVTRRLNDGQEYRIVKVFYKPLELTERLKGLGWSLKAEETDHYFIYGSGRKRG